MSLTGSKSQAPKRDSGTGATRKYSTQSTVTSYYTQSSFNQAKSESQNNRNTDGSFTNNNRLPLATVTGSANNLGGAGDSGNNVVCNCGEDAKQLTVKKEGPNTGKV